MTLPPLQYIVGEADQAQQQAGQIQYVQQQDGMVMPPADIS